MDKKVSDKKNKMNFPNLDSLQPVVNVLNEASITLGDSTRTVKDSPLIEVFSTVLGGTSGAGVSFLALYTAGTVGLSAAGITSALAAAGSIIGGGMVAGVFVLAAPIVGLAGVGTLAAKQIKKKQLRQEKKRLYEEIKEKYPLIEEEWKKIEGNSEVSSDRKDLIKGLSILLKKALVELEEDLLR